MSYDVLDDRLWQPWDFAKYSITARYDWEIERVELAVVAHQLRQAAEIEQVGMWQAGQRFEHAGQVFLGVLDEVIAHQGRAICGDADQHFLELCLDQAAIDTELDDVTLD